MKKRQIICFRISINKLNLILALFSKIFNHLLTKTYKFA